MVKQSQTAYLLPTKIVPTQKSHKDRTVAIANTTKQAKCIVTSLTHLYVKYIGVPSGKQKKLTKEQTMYKKKKKKPGKGGKRY
jgi:hypothetical protein